jgi:hypothetical protein
MAIQNIPLSFRLGGRDWKVTFVDSIEKGEIFAKWFDTKAEIQIAKNVLDDDCLEPCDDYQLEHSFWHELGHVYQYYSTGNTDDKFAQTFATFMMEFNKTKQNR